MRVVALTVAGLVAVAAVTVAITLLVVGAVGDDEPGLADFGELAEAIEDVEGYECDCPEAPAESQPLRGGGTVATNQCELSRDGRPVTPNGSIRVVLVEPRDAMGRYLSQHRTESSSVPGAITGPNWVIVGLPAPDAPSTELADRLAGARVDRDGFYGP